MYVCVWSGGGCIYGLSKSSIHVHASCVSIRGKRYKITNSASLSSCMCVCVCMFLCICVARFNVFLFAITLIIGQFLTVCLLNLWSKKHLFSAVAVPPEVAFLRKKLPKCDFCLFFFYSGFFVLSPRRIFRPNHVLSLFSRLPKTRKKIARHRTASDKSQSFRKNRVLLIVFFFFQIYKSKTLSRLWDTNTDRKTIFNFFRNKAITKKDNAIDLSTKNRSDEIADQSTGTSRE